MIGRFGWMLPGKASRNQQSKEVMQQSDPNRLHLSANCPRMIIAGC